MPNRYLLAPLAALALLAAPHLAQAQTGGVGIGIATPRAGLDVNHNNGLLATGTEGTGTIPLEGTGTRLMWYPAKGAFRAGTVGSYQDFQTALIQGSDYWDNANIGLQSTAFGYTCRASGNYSVAAGYACIAAGQSTLAIGEYNTASGGASVALGFCANTNGRQGTFVFADRSSTDVLRAAVNHSATWRVSGGFRLFTSSNQTTGVTIQSGAAPSWGQTNAVIATSTGAYLSTSGVWTNVSDRRKKHLVESVSGEDVLTRLRQVPITRWSYKADAPSVRHLGPMAQDFRKAFGLGADSVSIGTVDADGVALAGVQALDARSLGQAQLLATLQAENQALRHRLDALEHPAAAVAASRSGLSLPMAALLLLGTGLGTVLLRRR